MAVGTYDVAVAVDTHYQSASYHRCMGGVIAIFFPFVVVIPLL